MRPPVFGHGQLRLYLLSLLAEGPMSGYDIIRALEERSEGLYSPSAGTIYPRLAKLEEEGLVTRADEGRRSIYTITGAGREELERRAEEVAGLCGQFDDSTARLAEELRRRVADGASALWAQFDQASSEARRRAAGARAAGETPRVPGSPFEAFEALARDFATANRLRQDYGPDFARFAQWAMAGFEGARQASSRPGQGTPQAGDAGSSRGTGDAGEPGESGTRAEPDESGEIVADVIAEPGEPGETGTWSEPGEPGTRSEPGESGESGTWSEEPGEPGEIVADVIGESGETGGPGTGSETGESGEPGAPGPQAGEAGPGHGGLDAATVTRIAAILRTAADDLEAALKR